MMTFGQRLKYFRKQILQQTRKEFAQSIDVAVGNIQVWEGERHCITKSSIERLTLKINNIIETQAIPFNIQWLFNGTGNILPEETKSDEKLIEKEVLDVITYKVSSFLYEPIINNGTVLTLKKIDYKNIKMPCIIGYKDQSGVFYFGMATMSKNNYPILHYYAGSMQLLVLSVQDELYEIISYTAENYAEAAA